MGARDGDAAMGVDQAGQHLGAVEDRGLEALGLHEFRVIGTDGGADDQLRGAVDKLGRMADGHGGAQGAQFPGVGGLLGVGAAHGDIFLKKDSGDATHPDSAYTYEVDPAVGYGNGYLYNGSISSLRLSGTRPRTAMFFLKKLAGILVHPMPAGSLYQLPFQLKGWGKIR